MHHELNWGGVRQRRSGRRDVSCPMQVEKEVADEDACDSSGSDE